MTLTEIGLRHSFHFFQMERYPGRLRSDKNPLRLKKKVWYLSQCHEFLSQQHLDEINGGIIRDIASRLFKFQSYQAKLPYNVCSEMVKEKFGISNVEIMEEESARGTLNIGFKKNYGIGPGGLRAPCVVWPLLSPSFSLILSFFSPSFAFDPLRGISRMRKFVSPNILA